MLTIYHYPMTRGVRPIWLCGELGLDHHVELVDFSPQFRASPEWRAISPVGKLPVLRDDDLVMFESGAMVQYLLDRYGNGRLQPAQGSAAAAAYLQWSWFAEATLARPIGDILQHSRLKPEAERIPAVVTDATGRANICLDALDAHLDGRQYLLDEFSAADVMTGYSLLLAEAVKLDLDGRPNMKAYLDRLRERPALIKALSY